MGLAAGEQQGAVRGVSPGDKAARTAHAGSAEETVPGRARRCRSGCRRASAGSGRAAAGSPSSRRQFCRRHWTKLRKPQQLCRGSEGRGLPVPYDRWGYHVPGHTLCPPAQRGTCCRDSLAWHQQRGIIIHSAPSPGSL